MNNCNTDEYCYGRFKRILASNCTYIDLSIVTVIIFIVDIVGILDTLPY